MSSVKFFFELISFQKCFPPIPAIDEDEMYAIHSQAEFQLPFETFINNTKEKERHFDFIPNTLK